MSSSNSVGVIIEFIFGAVMTQLFLFIILAVMGGLEQRQEISKEHGKRIMKK